MDKQKVNDTEPIISFPSNQVVYIGMGPKRDQLEKIFNDQFPACTSFFNIEFKNFKIRKSIMEIDWTDIDEEIFHDLPDYIPHEYIKNCTEGCGVELELYGKKYIFKCCQKVALCYTRLSFETVMRTSYTKFLNKANCLAEGTWWLFHEKVIIADNNKFIQHGLHCASEAKKLIR